MAKLVLQKAPVERLSYLYEVGKLAMACRHGSVDISEQTNLFSVVERRVPLGQSSFALAILNQHVVNLTEQILYG